MATIHDNPALRDKTRIFRDRTDAGKALCTLLLPDAEQFVDPVVLAIPSGGVPIGLELTGCIRCPFDCVIVRKLPIPGNTEAGFGAVTYDGSLFLNQDMLAYLHITREQIESQANRVRAELEERNRLFRHGRPFPDLSGRTVIIADDGLASGYTMLASVETVRKHGSGKIIIAVPTAPERTIDKVAPFVDSVYCLNIRSGRYFAVADAYKNWHDLSKEEVIRMLQPREPKFS